VPSLDSPLVVDPDILSHPDLLNVSAMHASVAISRSVCRHLFSRVVADWKSGCKRCRRRAVDPLRNNCFLIWAFTMLSNLLFHRSTRSACSEAEAEARHLLLNMRRTASGDILNNSATSKIDNCGLCVGLAKKLGRLPVCKEFLLPPLHLAIVFAPDSNLLGTFSGAHFCVQPNVAIPNRVVAGL
jgi:hypothetical protein